MSNENERTDIKKEVPLQGAIKCTEDQTSEKVQG